MPKWDRNTPSLQLWSVKRPAQKCNVEKKKKSTLLNLDMTDYKPKKKTKNKKQKTKKKNKNKNIDMTRGQRYLSSLFLPFYLFHSLVSPKQIWTSQNSKDAATVTFQVWHGLTLNFKNPAFNNSYYLKVRAKTHTRYIY